MISPSYWVDDQPGSRAFLAYLSLLAHYSLFFFDAGVCCYRLLDSPSRFRYSTSSPFAGSKHKTHQAQPLNPFLLVLFYSAVRLDFYMEISGLLISFTRQYGLSSRRFNSVILISVGTTASPRTYHSLKDPEAIVCFVWCGHYFNLRHTTIYTFPRARALWLWCGIVSFS